MQKFKLNIGCGLTAPLGWVNIDNSLNARLAKWPGLRKILAVLHIISFDKANIRWPKDIHIYDVRRDLPFPNNSVEIIYCSHFLEHLSKQEAKLFLKECHRVLDTNGIIRIIVPDLFSYAEQYVKKAKQIKQEILTGELPAEKFLNDLIIFEKGSLNENILIRFYKKICNKDIHKWMYDEYSLIILLKKFGFSNIQRKEYYESLIEDIGKLDNPESFNDAVCVEAENIS